MKDEAYEREVCKSKVPYPNKIKAVSAINHINKRARAAKLRAYQCPFCASYHLTSAKQKR